MRRRTYKPGDVMPDGSIHGRHPGARVVSGLCFVSIEQMGLAIAKGWRAVPDVADLNAPGCGLVQRDER